MITNEWLQGYLSALKSVEKAVVELKKESRLNSSIEAFESVEAYVQQVRGNYKDLVEKLNKENKHES